MDKERKTPAPEKKQNEQQLPQTPSVISSEILHRPLPDPGQFHPYLNHLAKRKLPDGG